jgi:hypothetical protein
MVKKIKPWAIRVDVKKSVKELYQDIAQYGPQSFSFLPEIQKVVEETGHKFVGAKRFTSDNYKPEEFRKFFMDVLSSGVHTDGDSYCESRVKLYFDQDFYRYDAPGVFKLARDDKTNSDVITMWIGDLKLLE